MITTQHTGEQRYFSEEAAHRNRRTCIEAGRSVSLVAYDPDRDVWVFDILV